jgi:hypothetical protein
MINPCMKKIYMCFRCQEEIYLDPNTKSRTGKPIPLDPITNLPHDCPKKPFFKPRKTVGSEIMELEERESERIQRISYD